DKLNGQIANTVFQMTSEPARIVVSINRNNLTHEYIEKGGAFAVSCLGEETPMEFIGLFGFKSGREVDKLGQVKHREGATGSPVVTENALSVMEAKVVDKLVVATHTLFVGEVVAAEVLQPGKPMTYAYYQQVKKGRAPKSAPTYHAPEGGAGGAGEAAEPAKIAAPVPGPTMEKYVCNVCGYVYDPAAGDPDSQIPPGTSFENLPPDWKCPVCGASKDEFTAQ
ncbi:MAG: rubredoxin, partial [Bacillota bacterium]